MTRPLKQPHVPHDQITKGYWYIRTDAKGHDGFFIGSVNWYNDLSTPDSEQELVVYHDGDFHYIEDLDPDAFIGQVPTPQLTHTEHKDTLSLTTPDRDGYVPDKTIIGQRLQHTGNGKTYTITGFSWNGDTDQWNYLHTSPEGITVNRPMAHITGKRGNGEPRYHLLGKA